jgi:hypothetical protein
MQLTQTGLAQLKYISSKSIAIVEVSTEKFSGSL